MVDLHGRRKTKVRVEEELLVVRALELRWWLSTLHCMVDRSLSHSPVLVPLPADETLRHSCERVERIEEILNGAWHVLDRPICRPCLSEVTWKAKKASQYVNLCRAKYAALLSTGPLSGYGQSKSVNSYLKSASLEQLTSAASELESEILKLEEEEAALLQQSLSSGQTRRQVHCGIRELEQRALDSSFAETALASQRDNLLRRLDTSAREINFLRRVASPRAPLCALQPLFDAVRVEHNSYGVINGHRLAFRPSAQWNLNWAEINFSWANVAHLVLCARSVHGLPQCVDFSVCGTRALRTVYLGRETPSSSSASFPASRFAVRVQPLRDRVLLLVDRELAASLPPGSAVTSAEIGTADASLPQPPSCLSPRSPGESRAGQRKTVRLSAEPLPQGSQSPRSPVPPPPPPRLTQPLSQPTQHASEAAWTLHMEGGVQSGPVEEGMGTGEGGYGQAVLVLCAAVAVTLLEARLLVAGGKGQGCLVKEERKAEEREGWWVPLEESFVGHMQLLALALLVLGGDLGLGLGLAPPAEGGRSSIGPSFSANPSPRSWKERCAAMEEQVAREGSSCSLWSCLAAGTGSEAPGTALMDALVVDLLHTLHRHSAV